MLLQIGKVRDITKKGTRIIEKVIYSFQFCLLTFCLYHPSFLLEVSYVQSYNVDLNTDYTAIEEIIKAQPPDSQASIPIQYQKAGKHRKFNPTVYHSAQDEMARRQYPKYNSIYDPFEETEESLVKTMNYIKKEKRKEKYIEHKLGNKVEVIIEYNSKQRRRREKELSHFEKREIGQNLKGMPNKFPGEDKIVDEDRTSHKTKKRFFPDLGTKVSFFQFLFGYDRKSLWKKKRHENSIINDMGERIYTKDINSLYDLVITFFDEIFNLEHLVPGMFLAFLVTMFWILNKARLLYLYNPKVEDNHDQIESFSNFLFYDVPSNNINDYAKLNSPINIQSINKGRKVIGDIHDEEDSHIHRVESWINNKCYQNQNYQSKLESVRATIVQSSIQSADPKTSLVPAEYSTKSFTPKIACVNGDQYLSQMEEGNRIEGSAIKRNNLNVIKNITPPVVCDKTLQMDTDCFSRGELLGNQRDNNELFEETVREDNDQEEKIDEKQIKGKTKRKREKIQLICYDHKWKPKSFSKLLLKFRKFDGRSVRKRCSYLKAPMEDNQMRSLKKSPLSKVNQNLERKAKRYDKMSKKQRIPHKNIVGKTIKDSTKYLPKYIDPKVSVAPKKNTNLYTKFSETTGNEGKIDYGEKFLLLERMNKLKEPGLVKTEI